MCGGQLISGGSGEHLEAVAANRSSGSPVSLGATGFGIRANGDK